MVDVAPAGRRARTFVQLGEAPEAFAARTHYREGFRRFVQMHGDPVADTVVIGEVNPTRAAGLRAMWDDWADVRFTRGVFAPHGGSGASVAYHHVEGTTGPADLWSRDLQLVRRYNANARVDTEEVPAESLYAFLVATSAVQGIDLLSVDVRNDDAQELQQLPWDALAVEALALSALDVPRSHLRKLDRTLRRAGFRHAGRLWGEAGSGQVYRRMSTPRDAVVAAVAQARVNIGTAVVVAQRRSLDQETRVTLGRRLRSALDRNAAADVLDPSFGRPLRPVSRAELDEATKGLSTATPREVSIDVTRERAPMDVAIECFDRHGIWPISFSYPRPWPGRDARPREVLSAITPGFPYSFDDNDEYLRTYNASAVAVTHRKAGWDCFRHVEILASGSVPLMIDADDIPVYCMVHYPRRAMADLARRVARDGVTPDEETRAAFQAHFDQHLTSAAMARYLLHAAGLTAAGRVLFVDSQHPNACDYQSTLALIGLKQLVGVDCVPVFPVDWVYDDTHDETSHLYGRGFGYTRVLPGSLRSPGEAGREIPLSVDGLDLSSFDALVVGSVSRNLDLATELLTRFPAERTIWIHGEDSPPTVDEVRHLRASGTHLFVRSLESTPAGVPGVPRSLRQR